MIRDPFRTSKRPKRDVPVPSPSGKNRVIIQRCWKLSVFLPRTEGKKLPNVFSRFMHICCILGLGRGNKLLEIPTQNRSEQGFTSNCHVPLSLSVLKENLPPLPSSSSVMTRQSLTIKNSNPLLGHKITITMGHRPFVPVRPSVRLF